MVAFAPCGVMMMSKYSWRLAAPRLRFVLLAIFTIIAIVRGSATNAAETALPVASVVDSEGRLHLPEGYVGSVNVDNYALYTDTHGEPRFFPSSTAAQIPVLPLWAGFGEVRHGC